MSTPKSAEKNKKTNFHVIDLQWAHQMMPDYHEQDADVDIRVTSRKIKNQTVSPSDILFRTHHYEFELRPNQKFLSAYQKGRYVVELKLLKNVSHLKRKLYFDSNGQQVSESPDSPSSPSTPGSASSVPSTPSKDSQSQETTPFDAPLRTIQPPPQSPIQSPIMRQPPTSSFPIMPKTMKQFQTIPGKPLQPPLPTTTTNGMPIIQPPQPTVFTLPPGDAKIAQLTPTQLPRPIPPRTVTPQMLVQQTSPSRTAMPSPGRLTTISPTTPVVSTPSFHHYQSPFSDILNSCDPDCFVIRSRDQSMEYREFTEGDMPVVTYSFTEDSINSCWNLNLIWPVDRRQLSWRGKFVFFIRVYKRINHDTYSHMMSKISSPFCIFSKPDVFLKKIRKESGKKASPGSDVEEGTQDTTIPPPIMPKMEQINMPNGLPAPPIIPAGVLTSFTNRLVSLKPEDLKRKREATSDDEDDISGKDRVKRRFVNGSRRNSTKNDAESADFLAFVGSQGHVHMEEENPDSENSNPVPFASQEVAKTE